VFPLAKARGSIATDTYGQRWDNVRFGTWRLSPRVGPSNLHKHQDGGGVEERHLEAPFYFDRHYAWPGGTGESRPMGEYFAF
jgi:hypothetical protein